MPRRDRLTLPLLLLLTLVAGVLRFVSLDRPSVWGDEANTYGRIGGSYQDLLDQLTDAAFPPLHYEAEWWVAQGLPYWGTFAPPADEPEAKPVFTPTRRLVDGGIRLTPFALRFIPALAGTLFIPAIYFLARQLFGPRVALTAAALACFSAYDLVYSRDAKMYMHFWLVVTLHVGAALWWVRSRRLFAWAMWLLCGVVMIGLHTSGFYLLLIDGLIVFTSPRQHWRHLVTLGGLMLWPIIVLPAYGDEMAIRAHGLRPRGNWERALRWPGPAMRRFRCPLMVGFAVGMAVFWAAAYGPMGYYSDFSRKMQKIAEKDRPQVDTGELGISWVANYNRGRTLGDYVLYTTSAYLTGWEWPRTVDQPLVNPRTLRLLQGGTVALLALLAVGLVPWRRAFSPVRARLDRMRQDGRVAPPFVSRRVLWLGVWLFVLPWGFYTQSQHRPANPLDGAAALMLRSPPDITWPRCTTFKPVLADPNASPDVAARWTAVKTSFTAMAKQWPAAWTTYRAAWTGNVRRGSVLAATTVAVILLAFIVWKRQAIGWRSARLLGVILLLAVVAMGMTLAPQVPNDDVWMPRYLGAILPAAWLVVAVLIDRQPATLRWATMTLFVVINLSQFSARVWGNSEPPTGLMAADVAASHWSIVAPKPETSTFRAYTDFGRYQMPEPGGGTLFTTAGRYYLRLLSGVPGDVKQVRGFSYETNLKLKPFAYPAAVAQDLKTSPGVQRFVVWTAFDVDVVDQTDPLANLLKCQFKRTNEELFPVRDHWRWVERWQVRRRTYERINSSATQPAR